MNKKNIKILIERACKELIPRGVEHAWDHVDGSVLKWSDLLEFVNSVPDESVTTPIIFDDLKEAEWKADPVDVKWDEERKTWSFGHEAIDKSGDSII